jgi:hypothetical protein
VGYGGVGAVAVTRRAVVEPGFWPELGDLAGGFAFLQGDPLDVGDFEQGKEGFEGVERS